MGVKLLVEVLDHWQDYGLTAGERSDLLVIAENANDGTRATWGPMHEPYILKRAGKTAAGWRNAIGKLMKKGVLGYAVRDGRELSGFPGQHAVYRISVLCPDAPHDGLRGQCTRTTTERVTSEVTQSEGGSTTGHPTGDPIDGTGHLTGAERVTSQVTPTPLVPSITTPPPVADVPDQRPAPTPGGGGEDAPQQEEEHQRAASFVGTLDFGPQKPNPHQRQRMTQQVADAFKNGWQPAALREQIEPGSSADSRLAVYLHRLKNLDQKPPVIIDPAAFAAPSPYVQCAGPGCTLKMLPTPDGLCRECRQDTL